jgi:hypothetical protein
MSVKLDDQLALAYLALIDMERVQTSIGYLRNTKEKDLKDALFRDAVISYAKPFLNNLYSDGTKGLSINKSHIPNELDNIHHEVLDLRNKLIAHTDMTLQKPKISESLGEVGCNFSMSVSGYQTIHKDHLIEPLYKLAKVVHANLMSYLLDKPKN